MALKCLNCHLVCAADDPICMFCGYKIKKTSTAQVNDGAKKGRTGALIFVIIGATIFNTVIGPTCFPDFGQRVLAAGAVGAVCAVVGMFVGQLLSND